MDNHRFVFYAIPALDTAIKPYIIKIILDRVQTTLPQNAFDALWGPITCFVGLSLFVVIIYRLIDYAWMYLNPGVKCYAGDLLMQRMMLHSHQLYQEHFTGSIAARIKEVMSGIPDLIKLIGDGFFSYLIILPTSVYIIAQIHPFLSWTLAIWLVIFISLSYLLAKGVKKYAADSAKARSKTMGAFVDILGNIISVRLFSAKKFEQDYLAGFLDEYYTADIQRDWYTLKMFALLGVSFVIYISVSCFWLIDTFSKGQVTVGNFALVLSLSITLMERLWSFSKDIGKLSDLVGTLTQSLKLILSPIQIANQDNAPDLDIKEGTIDFENVQFSYEENKPLFQNKTVKIKSGEKVGLVGYSGISMLLLILWATVQIKSFFQDYENKWLRIKYEKIHKRTSGNFAEQIHLSNLFVNYISSNNKNPSVTINGVNRLLKGRMQVLDMTWNQTERSTELRLKISSAAKKNHDIKKYINHNYERILGDVTLSWDEHGSETILLIQQREAGQHGN